MNLILHRVDFCQFGIFGSLKDDAGKLVAVTLEHAYPVASSFMPKIPPGIHMCVRGEHRLSHMTHDFTTFEIMVNGHNDLLFHWGNYNADSSGCILLGEYTSNYNGQKFITNSRKTFEQFMQLQGQYTHFELTVLNPF